MVSIYILCDPRETDPIKRVRYVGATKTPAARRGPRRSPPRLRLPAHPDIRDAVAIPQPPCPAGEQEQVLVSAQGLATLRNAVDQVQPDLGHLREVVGDL